MSFDVLLDSASDWFKSVTRQLPWVFSGVLIVRNMIIPRHHSIVSLRGLVEHKSANQGGLVRQVYECSGLIFNGLYQKRNRCMQYSLFMLWINKQNQHLFLPVNFVFGSWFFFFLI